MSYWEKKELNLGVIKAGKSLLIIFEGKKDIQIPAIEALTSSCGCSVPKYNKSKNQIEVTYNNSGIPNQVVGAQNITKYITVKYDTGLSEVLTFKATRIR